MCNGRRSLCGTLESAFRDRHFDWSTLSFSLSICIQSTQVFRRSIYAQCVHTVWQSLSVLQYFALPNPVQCPSPHSAQYHAISHRPSTCACWCALFRNIMREKQTKRRRWTVDSGLKTVNSSGGTRKTVIAIVVVAAAVFSLVKFSFYLFSLLWLCFYCTFCCKMKRNKAKFWITSSWFGSRGYLLSCFSLFVLVNKTHTQAHTHSHTDTLTH